MTMLQKTKSYLTMLIIALVMIGCKSLEVKQPIDVGKLPDNYNFPLESTSNEIPEWRKYFGDSLLVVFVEAALRQNMQLQMASQMVVMNRAGVLESSGALFPKLAFGSSAALRRFGLYTMDGAGNASTEILPGKIVPTNLPDFYLGPVVGWEVDVWGKLSNNKKADVARYMASVEAVHYFTTMLVAEIATNYALLKALHRELTIVRQMLAMQNQAVEIIIAQKEAGQANELALQQFKGQVLESRGMELEISQQILETEYQLNYLMGSYNASIPNGPSERVSINFELLGITSPAQLLSARPDIKEAEFDLQATNFDLTSAKRAFLPSFNFIGNFGWQAFSGAFLFATPASIAYTALLGMAAPALNLSALKAQFVNANARQLHALYRYHDTIMNAYREVANEYTKSQNLAQLNAVKAEQAQLLLSSVSTSTELYKTGRATYLEVLLAQQNALNAQLETVSVEMQQSITHINLYRALGGGWQ